MLKILFTKLGLIFVGYIAAVSFASAPSTPQNSPPQQSWDQSSVKVQPSTLSAVKPEIKAIVSYYTVSANETDDQPCITADGTNACNPKENLAASNWLPFGTLIEMDGKIYRVADRMNQRYQKPYIDILVKTKFEARKKGKQNKLIKILN